MAANATIDPEIQAFYATGSEEERLQLGLGPLEFERNKELIVRNLPEGKCVIIDIGGGPGVYAGWLASLGHDVTLIDPVPRHIKSAQKKASRMSNSFRAIEAEARNVPLNDHLADIVILHGPLYHLQEKQQRLDALAESRRLLKPGGKLLAFAINHCASTLVALLNGMIHLPGFREMCLEELTTGRHEPLPNVPGLLPKAYFHRPEELRQELSESGFTIGGLYAVEGMIWLDSKYFETRADSKKKAAMFELLRATEQNDSLLSWSPHMMAVGNL